MSDPRQVLIDVDGDNSPPRGYVVVDDAVGLVEHALESGPLYVRGEYLCRWAGNLAVGRGWSTIELRSPALELCEQCVGLSTDEARTVINELGNKLPGLRRPLQLQDVLEALWGDVKLWAGGPDIEHAFRWLSWVAQQTTNGPQWKLVWQLAQSWQARAEPLLQRAYSARSRADGWTLLKEWLKVSESQQAWPASPQPVLAGSLPHRLKQDLTKQAVETHTDFFVALLDRAPDKSLLETAGQVCADVLLKNPQEARAERVRRLANYIPYDTNQKLNDLIEPEDPGLPQWQFDLLEAWFIEKYLPYREWTYRRGVTGDRRGWGVNSAADFAWHYLEYYVSARVGGDGAEHFAWAKSARLRSCGRDSAYLLIVLDGLSYPDALRLRRQVEQHSPRLSLDRQAVALAPLPTVTEFAKPAVAKGMLPWEAIEDTTTIAYTSIDEVGRALSGVAPGDVVVWALQEPDRTYHFRADAGPDSVRLEADGQLSTIAQSIASLAEKAPSGVRLRVVITTDHGRMLASAERTRHIPQGMKAHGRAAWGSCDVRFDKRGYLVGGDLVYLDPARFGLPGRQVYAIIVSDQAFVTTDGRGGNEPFPHGGLFPEEVLVPWLEFTRDRAPFTVEVALRGKGEEGKAGWGVLTVVNLGYVPIKVVGLTVDMLGTRVVLDEKVGALDKRSMDVALPKWPRRQELDSLKMCLTYVLPDGQPVRREFRPELETESIYEKPDILGELEGL